MDTFKELLERFEQAVRDHDSRGGGHPADIPAIEQDYTATKKAVIAYVSGFKKGTEQ